MEKELDDIENIEVVAQKLGYDVLFYHYHIIYIALLLWLLRALYIYRAHGIQRY